MIDDLISMMDSSQIENIIKNFTKLSYEQMESLLDQLLDEEPTKNSTNKKLDRKAALAYLKEQAYFAEVKALRCIHNNLLEIRKSESKKHDSLMQSIIGDLTHQMDQGYLGCYEIKVLDQILDTHYEEIVGLLPYLLTSYFVSYSKNKVVHKKMDTSLLDFNSMYEIFEETGDLDSARKHNYDKDIKSLVTKFSFHLSISREIKKIESKLQLFKEQDYKIRNETLSDSKRKVIEKQCENLIAIIEPVFSYWLQVFTYCVTLCKDIKNVNFTLSTLLFSLSALNYMGDKSDKDAAFLNFDSTITTAFSEKDFEDYLKADIIEKFSDLYDRIHKQPTEEEIKARLMLELI